MKIQAAVIAATNKRWPWLIAIAAACTIAIWPLWSQERDQSDESLEQVTAPLGEEFSFEILADPEHVVLDIVLFAHRELRRIRHHGDGRMVLTRESRPFTFDPVEGVVQWRREVEMGQAEANELVRFAVSRGLADYTQESLRAKRRVCGKGGTTATSSIGMTLRIQDYERGSRRRDVVENKIGVRDLDYLALACTNTDAYSHLKEVRETFLDLWKTGGGQ